MTDLSAIPLRAEPYDFVTYTNADWTDSFSFAVAGAAAGYPAANNVGNGALTIGVVAAQTTVGTHSLEIVETPVGDPARFVVRAPDGALSGIGEVGAPTAAGGIELTLAAGPTAFVVGDRFSVGVLPSFLDVTGIDFALMWRKTASAATVDLDASVENGLIVNGGLLGLATMAVPYVEMRDIPAGEYLYDLVAEKDGHRVVPFRGTITHIPGITKAA